MVKRALLFALAISVSLGLAKAETFSIPAGSTIHCRLTQTVSTKLNYEGDAFTATVSEPYMVNSEQIIPAGSVITGKIASLTRPGRIRGVGHMLLRADQVTLPNGHSYAMNAVLITAYGAEGAKVEGDEGSLKGPTSRMHDLKEVGIGMGGGGFIGTLFGGAHGAVVGGAIGGAVGLVDTLRKRGKDLTLPSGTQLNYQLTSPLVVDTSMPSVTASSQEPASMQ